MTRVKPFTKGNSRTGSPFRPLIAACAALIIGLTMAGQAHASFAFAQYDDVGGNNFTFTSTSTSASFTGTADGFLTFDSFGGQPSGSQPVTITLNLTANATDKASSGFGLTSQPFTPTGTLTFTAQAGGPNPVGSILLTATFNGTLVGTTGGGLPSMDVVVPTNSFTLTSGVASIQAALTAMPATGMQLNVDNLIQPGGGNGPSISGTTGYLNNFNSNLTGQFNGPDPVPEPGSVVLFGIGLSTAALVAVRRKASATLPIG